MIADDPDRETRVLERSERVEGIDEAEHIARAGDRIDLPRIQLRSDWIAKDPARSVELVVIAIIFAAAFLQLVLAL